MILRALLSGWRTSRLGRRGGAWWFGEGGSGGGRRRGFVGDGVDFISRADMVSRHGPCVEETLFELISLGVVGCVVVFLVVYLSEDVVVHRDEAGERVGKGDAGVFDVGGHRDAVGDPGEGFKEVPDDIAQVALSDDVDAVEFGMVKVGCVYRCPDGSSCRWGVGKRRG
jgi:hypothetical protein